MNKKLLRQRYSGYLPGIRRVLANERLRGDIPSLQGCLRRYPNASAVKSCLANALAGQGRTAQAVSVWRSLLASHRSRASVYFQRAHWAMRASRYREAEKFLRLCLRHDDGYFGETAHFWRAESLARLGLRNAALAALASVSDEYSELYFFGRMRWSKAELKAELGQNLRHDA